MRARLPDARWRLTIIGFGLFVSDSARLQHAARQRCSSEPKPMAEVHLSREPLGDQAGWAAAGVLADGQQERQTLTSTKMKETAFAALQCPQPRQRICVR